MALLDYRNIKTLNFRCCGIGYQSGERENYYTGVYYEKRSTLDFHAPRETLPLR